jgi:hypothetical protein
VRPFLRRHLALVVIGLLAFCALYTGAALGCALVDEGL